MYGVETTCCSSQTRPLLWRSEQSLGPPDLGFQVARGSARLVFCCENWRSELALAEPAETSNRPVSLLTAQDRKKSAVQNEDYDAAKALKSEIDRLRRVFAMVGESSGTVEQSLLRTSPKRRPTPPRCISLQVPIIEILPLERRLGAPETCRGRTRGRGR